MKTASGDLGMEILMSFYVGWSTETRSARETERATASRSCCCLNFVATASGRWCLIGVTYRMQNRPSKRSPRDGVQSVTAVDKLRKKARKAWKHVRSHRENRPRRPEGRFVILARRIKLLSIDADDARWFTPEEGAGHGAGHGAAYL